MSTSALIRYSSIGICAYVRAGSNGRTGGNGRAGGNGTTGTAMAVPVFEGEKNGIAWILTYAWVME